MIYIKDEKLSKRIAAMEQEMEKAIADGYSPEKNPFSMNVIDLLKSIFDTASSCIEEEHLSEYTQERNEAMLHIRACVSNINVLLGLPPISFSRVMKPSEYSDFMRYK